MFHFLDFQLLTFLPNMLMDTYHLMIFIFMLCCGGVPCYVTFLCNHNFAILKLSLAYLWVYVCYTKTIAYL